MSFVFTPLQIADLIFIEASCMRDDRGLFLESYRTNIFSEAGIPAFVQENHACSRLNVLRGLHYQLDPYGQGKLVRCIRGKIYDVAVDIRKGSPSFGHWVSLELSAENLRMLYVPVGFAHGYCALTDNAEVTYKTTAYWSPEHERTIFWNDPDIGISWPTDQPLLSTKDQSAPNLNQADINFLYS